MMFILIYLVSVYLVISDNLNVLFKLSAVIEYKAFNNTSFCATEEKFPNTPSSIFQNLVYLYEFMR